MKRCILTMLAAAGFAIPSQAQVGRSVSDLAWMAGCWQGWVGGRQYEEHWIVPGGETMLGLSRTVESNTSAGFEFMRIHKVSDDSILYTAQPSGQAEASFALVYVGADSVVFENQAHDFPQRISYRLAEDSVLTARVEGRAGGREKSVDYVMKKVKCD